jgi:hypothetical protein
MLAIVVLNRCPEWGNLSITMRSGFGGNTMRNQLTIQFSQWGFRRDGSKILWKYEMQT